MEMEMKVNIESPGISLYPEVLAKAIEKEAPFQLRVFRNEGDMDICFIIEVDDNSSFENKSYCYMNFTLSSKTTRVLAKTLIAFAEAED